MVSFELGKEIEKYFFRLVTSVGQRKNSAFPGGKGSDALQLSHSDSTQVPLRSLYNIRPAYCWDQHGVPMLVTRRKTSLTKKYWLFILVNQENWRWHGLAIRVGIEIAWSLSIIDHFVSAAVRLNLRHRCGCISMGHCRRSMVASCYWSVFRAPIGAHGSSLVIKDKQCSSWNVRSILNLKVNNFTKIKLKQCVFLLSALKSVQK